MAIKNLAIKKKSAFSIGEKVFIRTVTHYLTGEITNISETIAGLGFLELKDAAWIADTGRFMNAIENGALDEVEPVTCPVRVNIGSIIDVYEWRHELPRKQK
jgi:hypothetical protein